MLGISVKDTKPNAISNVGKEGWNFITVIYLKIIKGYYSYRAAVIFSKSVCNFPKNVYDFDLQAENNFINQVLFNDFQSLRPLFPEYLSQDRHIAGVFDLKIDRVADVIEKGFEAGVPIVFCGWVGSVSELGQKGKDLIRSDGLS